MAFNNYTERLDQHRYELNDLHRKWRTTETFVENTNKSLGDDLDAITKLQQQVKEGEGLCATRCFNTVERLSKLEQIVPQLLNRIDCLENSLKRRCKSCSKVFVPVKLNHDKCSDCFLSLKPKLCKKCSKVFTPSHHTFQFCKDCSRKKPNKSKKLVLKSILKNSMV